MFAPGTFMSRILGRGRDDCCDDCIFLYSQTDSTEDKAKQLNNEDVTLHLIRKIFSG